MIMNSISYMKDNEKYIKKKRMNMRVEKHVLSILHQSGAARDSSGMRYIKLQGCLEFYNSIMATDFHFPPNFQRRRRRMTQ